jgi:hypothetical protein
MPDPFLIIVGFIALLTIVLFPIRMLRRRQRCYGTEDEGGEEVPLAPPERRNRG